MEYDSLYFFVLSNKLPGYNLFCEPETIHYVKLKTSVLNTKTISLESDNRKEVEFNQETMMIKHYNWSKSELIEELSKSLKRFFLRWR